VNRPLDESYFEWLYFQVGARKNTDPNASYWKLLKLLYFKEFVWVIPNDDNRAEDGRALRIRFLQETDYESDPDWFEYPCSVLELLIALSERLAFEGDGEPRTWFWVLIDNLGLYHYRDGRKIPVGKIEETIDILIWRNYEPDGNGGLFPLKNPSQDQRDVDIWYQMNAYLLERV
jgi:hypothetical protein